MKIIIAYASAGSGHFKSAQALYDYFKCNNRDWDLELIDVLEQSNFLFRNIYSYGYAFLIRHALGLWSLVFCITYAKALRLFTRRINFLISRVNTRGFIKFLLRQEPDFVISTHFLPSEIAAYLKRSRRIKSRLITVITDLGVHPFWVCKETDIYVAASDYTQKKLLAEGVPQEKIKILGIPIDAKFLKRRERGVLSEKFGLLGDKFTVLVVTGSFGIGPIEKIADMLHKDIQLLLVCANNKRLYRRLKDKNCPQVKIFGFVHNIQELMAVSDIIVTKPGGLTIAEVLSMELVPLFICAIPGHETENARALEEYGVGANIKNIRQLRQVILDYSINRDALEQIKKNMRKIKKPFAAEGLYNVICQSSPGLTG